MDWTALLQTVGGVVLTGCLGLVTWCCHRIVSMSERLAVTETRQSDIRSDLQAIRDEQRRAAQELKTELARVGGVLSTLEQSIAILTQRLDGDR